MVSLKIGLAISLFGMLLVQIIVDRAKLDSLKLLPKLSYWLLGFSVFVIAALQSGQWLKDMGIRDPSLRTFWAASLTILAQLAIRPFSVLMQKSLSGVLPPRIERLDKIVALPFKYQIFIALTAAIVEEVLFRSYAIGIGQYLLPNIWWASTLSLAAFVAVHYRWGLSHIIPVFISGLLLSLLFIATNDLLACVIAHLGFIIVTITLKAVGHNNSFKPNPLRSSKAPSGSSGGSA